MEPITNTPEDGTGGAVDTTTQAVIGSIAPAAEAPDPEAYMNAAIAEHLKTPHPTDAWFGASDRTAEEQEDLNDLKMAVRLVHKLLTDQFNKLMGEDANHDGRGGAAMQQRMIGCNQRAMSQLKSMTVEARNALDC